MSLTLSGLETISKIASNSSGVIGKVFAGIEKYKDIKADEKTYMRLLYLEVLHNLEILATIDVSKLKKISKDDPGFKLLIDQLSIEIMSGIFVPDGQNTENIFRFLDENGEISYTNESSLIVGQEHLKGKKIETTVLKSIVYLVTKIEALKKVSLIGEQVYMKNVNLAVRVKNIQNRLHFLRMKFKDYDSLKSIS